MLTIIQTIETLERTRTPDTERRLIEISRADGRAVAYTIPQTGLAFLLLEKLRRLNGRD